MATLDVTGLRYFLAIARHANLTRAAGELGITQPALTIALRRLEEVLGTTLFARTREGVSITATGEELVHHATELLAGLERAEQAVAGLESGERGRFVMGCPESLAIYFMPTVVARVARELPLVELALVTARSRDVEQAVLRREVHFGIVARPLPHPDLVLVDLFRDWTGLFARRGRRLGAAMVRRGPLVYVDGLPQTQEILSKLDERGLVPEHRLPCGTLELVKAMTAEGVGIGILPSRVAAYGTAGTLAPLGGSLPRVNDTIRLIYRADLHRTRAAMHLKDLVVGDARRFEGRT
jgi:DNA-binding transcriptional LysR family regulator